MATRHGLYNFGEMYTPRSSYYAAGKFGRLFGCLPPFAPDTPGIRTALLELGRAGGMMDAADDLSDPKALIVDPTKFVNNPDNPRMTAGLTFLGQFLDHDLTFDPTSSLERQVDPEAIANFRTPLLELDSVYGAGPSGSPHLYDHAVDDGQTKLLIEPNPGSPAFSRLGAPRDDVPRNSQGIALLGDPRNDENLILDQLQLAFLKFHNHVVDVVRADRPTFAPFEVFAEAQRLVRWHYQWIILHEFLPLTIGRNRVERILENGRKIFHFDGEPFIPVEFAVAAYRFGHSQVRPSYRMNFGPAEGQDVFLLIFNQLLPDGPDPDDMRGGKRAGRRFIDWQTFFDFGDGKFRNNKRIDTKLSSVLFDLLGIPAHEPQSLAQRNFLRHLTFKLPSGQRVARMIAAPELAPADLADLQPLGLHRDTPLWFYVLREAHIMNGGEKLGPVGGRIVGEVFIGVLQGDPMSFLYQDPTWTPTLGTGGDFKITDLLRLAGVVPPLV